MIDLSGKRALVTGGSRGIGAAIALALAENGADVAFTYHSSAERAEGVAKSIARTGRRGIAIRNDSGAPDAIARSVSEAVAALGGIDILVNNSGKGLYGPLVDIDISLLNKIVLSRAKMISDWTGANN